MGHKSFVLLQMSEAVAESLLAVGKATREASRVLAALSNEERNQALHAIAAALERDADAIVAANVEDCKAAEAEGMYQFCRFRYLSTSAPVCVRVVSCAAEPSEAGPR